LDVANDGAVAAALMSFGRRAAALRVDPLDCDLEPIAEAGGRLLRCMVFFVRVGDLLGRSIEKLRKDLAEVFCISVQNMDIP
jgi:hypothetical protein